MSLLFVSAQPDVPYFHWQCEIYLHNFIKLGIPPENIHVLFGMVSPTTKPSEGALALTAYTKNIHFYEDTRDKKHYIPSIKPFLINKWLKEFPQYGESFFLHDSDIIFRELPDLDRLLNDDIIYMSNTKGYISHSYIMSCGKRYSKKHNIPEDKLLNDMAYCIGVEPYIIKNAENKSGGAQYVFKKQTHHVWFKIYKDSNKLYDMLLNFQKRYPTTPGEIQFWTAEMWSTLWNMWYFGYRTEITDMLDFCWATDGIDKYEKTPILHMAGVTEKDKKTKFFKGDFIDKNPINILKEDFGYFDYIDETNSTIKYINELKELVKK
jgi:hypothetical protein